MSKIIKGDGSFNFQIEIDGDDLVVREAKATWFGGPDDPDDSGATASGVNTVDHPHVIGCALPMDLSIKTAFNPRPKNYKPTKGSGLPRIPWHTAISVTGPTGTTVDVPLLDIGPSKGAGNSAVFDLTPEAFVGLGGKADFKHNSGDMIVSYRINGGTKYLT